MVQEIREEDRVRESEQGTRVRELEQENSLSVRVYHFKF
jgi:hypothetical protein